MFAKRTHANELCVILPASTAACSAITADVAVEDAEIEHWSLWRKAKSHRARRHFTEEWTAMLDQADRTREVRPLQVIVMTDRRELGNGKGLP